MKKKVLYQTIPTESNQELINKKQLIKSNTTQPTPPLPLLNEKEDIRKNKETAVLSPVTTSSRDAQTQTGGGARGMPYMGVLSLLMTTMTRRALVGVRSSSPGGGGRGACARAWKREA